MGGGRTAHNEPGYLGAWAAPHFLAVKTPGPWRLTNECTYRCTFTNKCNVKNAKTRTANSPPRMLVRWAEAAPPTMNRGTWAPGRHPIFWQLRPPVLGGYRMSVHTGVHSRL